MNHTKEPWELKKIDTEEYEYIGPLSGSGQIGIDSIFCREEDAERVIACVNACSGVDNETLEKSKVISAYELNKKLLYAAQQRDELLAVLKEIARDSFVDSWQCKLAEQAIAKAEQSHD